MADTGSFGRAALYLGYTQSAVSQQIAALEALLGERLVERSRGPRPVLLTEPGHLLARHAETIVATLRAACADVTAYQTGETGEVRIGTFQSVGAHILPGVVRAFATSWPRVTIRLTEDDSDEALLEQVTRGDLDLAFCMAPLPEGPFEAIRLLADPWVLLAAADTTGAAVDIWPRAETSTAGHVASGNDHSDVVAGGVEDIQSVSVQALAGCPLIGSRRCRSAGHIEDQLRSQGIEPQVIFRSDDNGTVRGLVAAGIGAAVVPELTVEPDPRIRVYSLTPALAPRVVALAWHRERYRSPATRAFIDTAVVYCQRFIWAVAPDVIMPECAPAGIHREPPSMSSDEVGNTKPLAQSLVSNSSRA